MKPTYIINDVPLDDPAGRWRLDAETTRRALPAVRSTAIASPHRHGETTPTGDPYDPTNVGLSLHVTDRNPLGVPSGPAQTERNLELITGLLYSRPLLELTHQIGDQTRIAPARITSSSQPEARNNTLTHYQLHYVLTIPGVFWTDPDGPQTTQGPTDPREGTLNLPALAGGTAPITDAIIRIRRGIAGRYEVTDPTTGTGLILNATGPGGYVYIDADTLTAWQSGTTAQWERPTEPTDLTELVDYPPAGPLQITPTATAGGTTYALNYSYPSANSNDVALGVHASRKYL